MQPTHTGPNPGSAGDAFLSIGRGILFVFTSLRLTIVLLILAIVLVFAATLDQVHLGVWGVQAKYFHSFFVFVQIPGSIVTIPAFPGGYLLGGVLIANLIAAHFGHFRYSWKKSGIWLTHLGLILLLIGEGLSGMFQKDGQMRLDIGQTRRYAESFRDYELAVVDATDPTFDTVISVPVDRLRRGETVQDARLPFMVRPVAYYANATLRMRSQTTGAPPSLATRGGGPAIVAQPAPVTAKENESNWPTAFVELKAPDGSLGTWLVSALLDEPQTFAYEGRTWRLSLRPRRDELTFALTLEKFTHDIYPGTQIPKNFASTVRLRSDDGRDDRRVEITMNHPLRYGGRAFYQAGYDNNDRTSVLQVVRNPGWQIPYLSCGLIAFGLAVQFCIHLFGFLRKRGKPAAGVNEVGSLPRQLSPSDS